MRRLIHANLLLIALVGSPAFAQDGQPKEKTTPPQATQSDGMPPRPPEPPKPGHEPKLSPREQLEGDVINAVDRARDLVEDYYEKNHAWPTSMEQVGADPKDLPKTFQSRSLGTDGVIILMFRGTVPTVGGKTVMLTPQVSGDGRSVLGWNCSAPDIPANDSPCPPTN